MKDLVIIGAGGLGREMAAMVKSAFADSYHILGFVDDGITAGTLINGFEVLGNIVWLNSFDQKLDVLIAIGNPSVKAEVKQNIKKMDIGYPNLVHPNAHIHSLENISMGEGNIITDGCILTTNIKLGNFNLINLACTIGHDTVIGDYCSVMPGVNISGGANLQNRVYVGTGAKLIKATVLQNNCSIGAGAVVNTNVPDGKTFVGVPAKDINNG